MYFVFQSIHIVMHHSRTHSHNHELCNEYTTTQTFDYKYTIEFPKGKPCLICDCHFSINDLPKISIYRSISLLVQGILNESPIHLHFQELFSLKSPRAPPVRQ